MTALPDWSGTLSLAPDYAGKLLCAETGWLITLTATPDPLDVKRVRKLQITGRFDQARMPGDLPAPWNAEMALLHHFEAHGFDRVWSGTLSSDDGKTWRGLLFDAGAGRIGVAGKLMNGVLSLRAWVQMGDAPQRVAEVAA